MFAALDDTEIVPLLIDRLITVTRTFCDFFLFSCYFCLTVISRGSILRIQIRGTCTPQTSQKSRITTARLELDDTKPGSKRKTERELLAPRPHLRRGTCSEGWKPFTSSLGRAFAFHAAFTRTRALCKANCRGVKLQGSRVREPYPWRNRWPL